MDIINQITRKARKEHVCDWCQQPIAKGEEYQYSTIVEGGEIYNWKNHLHCMELYKALEMGNGWGDGVDSNDFTDSVQCYLQDNLSKEEYDALPRSKWFLTACKLLKINCSQKEESGTNKNCQLLTT